MVVVSLMVTICHPDGHSKILGYCFDGFPVYGPFGYDVPFTASQTTVICPRVIGQEILK